MDDARNSPARALLPHNKPRDTLANCAGNKLLEKKVAT
jgi:hypothetical protein